MDYAPQVVEQNFAQVKTLLQIITDTAAKVEPETKSPLTYFSCDN